MKIRNGFVSNSSSSSFICDFCGNVYSGYDISAREAGYTHCVNGHVFCLDHLPNDFDLDNLSKDLQYEILSSYIQKDIESDKQYLQRYLSGEIKNKNGMIEYYQTKIPKNEQRLKDLETDHTDLSDEEFNDKYCDELYDMISDFGIPERFCPVCNRQKEMSKDEKYNQYLELYNHFNQVKPDGTV